MDEKPFGLLWMRNGSSVVDNRLDYQSRDSKIDLPLLRGLQMKLQALDETLNRGPFSI